MAEKTENGHGFAEAPCSVTMRAISADGFSVMLTLRDVDAKSLMPRVMAALGWLSEQGFKPDGYPSGQANGNGSAAPLCPVHHKAMKPSRHGNGGWYCPVKLGTDDNGKAIYCDERVKLPAEAGK